MTKNYFQKNESVYIPYLRTYGNILSVKAKYHFISCWFYKTYLYTIKRSDNEIIENILEDDIMKISNFLF